MFIASAAADGGSENEARPCKPVASAEVDFCLQTRVRAEPSSQADSSSTSATTSNASISISDSDGDASTEVSGRLGSGAPFLLASSSASLSTLRAPFVPSSSSSSSSSTSKSSRASSPSASSAPTNASFWRQTQMSNQVSHGMRKKVKTSTVGLRYHRR